MPWRGRAESARNRASDAIPGTPAGKGCSRCTQHDPGARCARLPRNSSSLKYHVTVQYHRRIGCALQRQMTVDHRIAEDAPDIAFHHAAEAIIACAQIDADIVNLVLERLQMIAAVYAV